MSSAQELKKVRSVSLVNPLVLETLEKLIDKKKNTAKVAFNSDLQKIYSTVTQKSFNAAETLIKNLIDFLFFFGPGLNFRSRRSGFLCRCLGGVSEPSSGPHIPPW